MPEETTIKNTNIITKINIKLYLIIFSIIELILILFITVLFYLTIPLNSAKILFIPKGSTKNALNYLEKFGFEVNNIDYITLKYLGYPQSGWIDLKETRMTKYDFLYKLTTSKAALKRITLIPGETYYYLLQQIQTELNLNIEKLYQAYNELAYKKDGNILAESYDIPLGMDEKEVLFYLINYTDKRYEEFATKVYGEYNKRQWYYYVSIASVIQKESANAQEMPIVSSVVYNRLKKGMPLQMDGTLNYGIYSHEVVTAKRIREDSSDYNTYKNKGVPDNPICAVDFNALKSAIFPAKTEYLYFVRDKQTGLHSFSGDYNSHKQYIQSNIAIEREQIKLNKEQQPQSVAPQVDVEKINLNNNEPLRLNQEELIPPQNEQVIQPTPIIQPKEQVQTQNEEKVEGKQTPQIKEVEEKVEVKKEPVVVPTPKVTPKKVDEDNTYFINKQKTVEPSSVKAAPKTYNTPPKSSTQTVQKPSTTVKKTTPTTNKTSIDFTTKEKSIFD